MDCLIFFKINFQWLVKLSIEKRKERGEFLMLYAANQFNKLICFKNSSENEPKRKERCLYLKVSSLFTSFSFLFHCNHNKR